MSNLPRKGPTAEQAVVADPVERGRLRLRASLLRRLVLRSARVACRAAKPERCAKKNEADHLPHRERSLLREGETIALRTDLES